MNSFNVPREEDLWMTSDIVYELHKHLLTVDDDDGVTKFYQSQAEILFFRNSCLQTESLFYSLYRRSHARFRKTIGKS